MGAGYQSSATITVSAPGNYTVTVRDANGCTATDTITILPPLTAAAVATTQPSCLASDGVITITANGGAGAGNYEYDLLDSANASITAGAHQASNVFAGLAPGNYTAIVYDTSGSGCDAQVPVSLETPTPVVFTYNQENVSCFGGSDGSIQVVLDPSNNNPPYTYTLNDGTNPPTVQTGSLFTGLIAGSYDITVTSDRDCSDTQTVVIIEPVVLDVTATATDFACNVDNSVAQAVITAVGTDGTAPYTYSINGTDFFASNTFNITDTSVSQTITVTVRDDNGCLDTTSVTIDPLNTFTAVISQTTAITCAGPKDVLITVSDDGNPANTYTYELLPIGNPNGTLTGTPTNVTATFDLTVVGNYVFRITDATTGCYVDTAPYDIAPYDLIDVVALATTPVTCFGDSDGVMEINVTDYTGNYSYEVFNSDGTTTSITNTGVAPGVLSIPGLSAGNFYVVLTATDTPFCPATSNTVTIGSPNAAINLVEVSNSNANCNIGAQVAVNASGGTPGYEYAFVQDGAPTPLAGDYTASASAVLDPATNLNWDVWVKDRRDCTFMINVVIAEDPMPTVSLPAYADDQCTSNGTSYTFTAIGAGVATLEYSVGAGYQSSATITVSAPGNYTVTVRDANGCTATDTITILPPLTAAAVATTQPSCLASDGVMTITANGGAGAGNYEYDLLDSGSVSVTGGVHQASNVFAGLAPGNYTAIVYDTSGSGCDAQVPVSLETPTPVVFTWDQGGCFL